MTAPRQAQRKAETAEILRALAVASVALVLSCGPAMAQDVPLDAAEEYSACMTLTRVAPEQAFESALAWRDQGGGHPAEHCASVALIALGNYEQAATRLEDLAQGMTGEEPELRAGVLAQAGQAWLIAGETERAHAVQSAALELTPEDVELLIDRSVTLASAANYADAVADLDRAAALAPERADVFVFRASAKRYLDDLHPALADAERALELDPVNPEGLLERGIIRRLLGDDAGAREDWLRVVELAGGTPTGEAAQANLARLDVKTE